MDFDGIVAKLKANWPGVEAPKVEAGDSFIIVPTEHNVAILKYLKDDPELAFDSLMCLSGVDTGREFWVVYSLHSFSKLHKVSAKVVLTREDPEVESVCTLWPAANFLEREIYDLYGIVFRNHPDLRRILNPPDWAGWPCRKDYDFPVEYHGVQTERTNQFFADAVEKGVEEREARDKVALEKLGLTEKK